MGHLRPNIFGEKENKKKIPRRSGLGMGTWSTCAKIQGIFLENGVDIWVFVLKNE